MTSRDLIIEDITLNLDKGGGYIEGKVQIFITFARHSHTRNLRKFRKNAKLAPRRSPSQRIAKQFSTLS